jgi:hypothetical protein
MQLNQSKHLALGFLIALFILSTVSQINAQSVFDQTFNPNTDNIFQDIIVQEDGKILTNHSFAFADWQKHSVFGLNAAVADPILKADYQFQGSLQSSVAGSPDLQTLAANNGNNSFVTEVIDGYSRQSLRFPQGNGLQLQPTTGTIANNAYTIVMLFKFDNVDGYRRILDFNNGISNSGFYVLNGNLNFFNLNAVSGTPIAANTYVQVALTRTSTGMVTAYVDGVPRYSFNDSSNLALIDSNNTLRFFKDNTSGNSQGEESAGSVARIRLYDAQMTTDQLRALDRVPEGIPTGQADIAFVSFRDGNLEIYTMKADGTEQRRLTNNSSSDSYPDWSPDGSKIAFFGSRDGNSEIYTMNADGSNQSRVTNDPAIDRDAVWSPDGNKLAFTSSRDGDFEIYILNLSTNTTTQLTNNTFSDTVPSWSPDGNQLTYTSNQDGDQEIFKMNADGTNQTQLTFNNFNENNSPWSPSESRWN